MYTYINTFLEMEEKTINNDILLYIILGTVLIICTVTDLRYKEIYIPVIIAGLLLILCFHIWQQDFQFKDMAATIIVFMFFMVSSAASRGQLGTGDAFLFALTGLGLGIMANIFIIIFSFMLAFFAALFLVLVKHKPKNYGMPLAPFVLSSFIIYIAGLYIPL
ncbi:MAG: prepilin peptidase [Lachnospiraceae bacterium]|nr:prepilin peptidase [Lachnospiraceae bacterium]